MEKTNKELKKELEIHPKTTIHQYFLWMPIDIYLKLYKIQEEKGHYKDMDKYSINNQIVEILKKHFRS